MSPLAEQLPRGWTTVALRELGAWSGGGTPSKRVREFWTGSIPWVSPKDMKVDRIGDSEDHITDAAVATSATRVVEPPSVLVVTRSGILAHSLPVAVTTVAVALNQDMKALAPSAAATADFIAHGLRAHAQDILAGCSKDGTTVHSIESERLLDYRLPLPPLPEQRRIVEAIDAHFSRLDEVEASLTRVQRNLKRYRAAVLQAAVEGRLVPTEAELAKAEGRGYEPASELLKRLLVERRRRWEEAQLAKLKAAGKSPKDDKWKSKYIEPKSPDTANLPSLPEGWCAASVGQLSQSITYGTSVRASADLDGGVPVLRMGNVANGRLSFRDLKALPRNHPDLAHLLLKPGDMLFNRTNSAELVGKSAVFTVGPSPCSFASYLIRVRFDEAVASPFVCAWLNSGWGRRWIASVVVQQVGQANVSGGKLARCALPLPPLAEQHRIVAEVDRLLSDGDEIEQTVTLSLERCRRLRQAILKWAFEGKLVDQDPNDEPASVLLDRLRAERATHAPAGRRARRRKRE